MEYSDGLRLLTDIEKSGESKVKELGEVGPMGIAFLYIDDT